jgi:radical SAM superfamily enzyme YgiQ (UPF0313 family)
MDATPPLSLASLAAALDRAGHPVKIVDGAGEALDSFREAPFQGLLMHGLSHEELIRRIDPSAEFIGVSAQYTHEWPSIRLLLKGIRSAFPGARIIIGGEHATAAPEECLADAAEIDAVVLGEGEETLTDLVGTLRSGGRPDSVPGIAMRRNGGTVRTAPRPRITDLDSLPAPKWDLVNLEPYIAGGWSFGVRRGRTMPVLASRGCPYRCAFCSNDVMWGGRRVTRSPASVVSEIVSYAGKYGVDNIDFYDQTAVTDRRWVMEFCELLIRQDLGITLQLPGGTRGEALDAEVLGLLRRAGLRNISLAPESGSERLLDSIGKKTDPDELLKKMSLAVSAGINVKANVMMGLPDETGGDVLETFGLLARMARLGVHDASVWAFVPYPGSALFRRLRSNGRIGALDDDYCHSLLAYSDLTRAFSYNGNMPPSVLRVLRIVGEMLFYSIRYSSPGALLDTFRHLAEGRHESRLEMSLANLARRLKLKMTNDMGIRRHA